MGTARVGEGAPLTAIVAAMEEEMASLRARLVGARRVSLVGAHGTVGRLGRASVALVVTGDGERNARRGSAALLAALPVRRLIFVGVAGGLSPNLGIGALVVGAHVVDEAGGCVHDADRVLVDLAAEAGGARRGVAVSASRIADTAEDKRRLLGLAATQVTGRPGSSALPAVVDLESATFASVAARASIPWLVLRAVSDTSSESVPTLLNRSRDEGGAVRRGRVVRGLLTSPRTLLPLLTLRGRVRTCAERLADAIEPTLAALYDLDAAPTLGAGLAPEPANTTEPEGGLNEI
jgi:adenosylhomocysteine nucleosidase